MKKFIKLCYLLYFLARFRNYRIAHFLAKDSFPLDKVDEIAVHDGKIIIKKTGQAFTRGQIGRCSQSFSLFLSLATHPEVVIDNSGNDMYIRWKDLRIRANTFDNFYVASELFVEGLYNIHCNDHRLVVCDVGMNVGVASLVFASMENVEKVYSYEPFKPTYESALANFGLNPRVKEKIVPFNLGAGGHTAELEIIVGDVDSATMSTTDFMIEQVTGNTGHKVKVQIRDIRDIVTEMEQRHPGSQIFLKLDCEGAEYEIMEQLHASGLLRNIPYIVIEWHMRGSAPLEKILAANNFYHIIFPRPTQQIPDMGMIYACRNGIA